MKTLLLIGMVLVMSSCHKIYTCECVYQMDPSEPNAMLNGKFSSLHSENEITKKKAHQKCIAHNNRYESCELNGAVTKYN